MNSQGYTPQRPFWRSVILCLTAILFTPLLPIYPAFPRGTPIPASPLLPATGDSPSPELMVQLGHSDVIEALTVSPDSRLLLTGSWDNSARLWSAETGAELRRFNHSAAVQAVSFSPDGQELLTASSDGSVRLWRTETGMEVRAFQGHRGGIRAAAFSQDGDSVVTVGSDGTARIWDKATATEQRRVSVGNVWTVVLSPDRQRLLIGGVDGTVRLLDLEAGAEIRSFHGHRTYVDALAFSADGRRILTGSKDSTARLWEVSTGAELLRLQDRFMQSVGAVAVSPDAQFLLTGSADNIGTRLWDARTGARVKSLIYERGSASAAAFFPDSRRLLVGRGGGTAQLWDAEEGEVLLSLEGRSGVVTDAVFSDDGRMILTGNGAQSARGYVRASDAVLWDSKTADVRRFVGHERVVFSVSLSPDGSRVLTGSSDETARLWDSHSGVELRRFEGERGVGSGPSQRIGRVHVAYSPDGRRVLTANPRDSIAQLFDLETGAELRRFQALPPAIFSPEGRHIIGHWEGAMRLWNAETGAQIRRFGDDSAAGSVAFSPDGRRILTGGTGERGRAQLWDVESGTELRRLEGHVWVEAVAISPDNGRLLTGGLDGIVRLWDARTGTELRQLVGHSGRISAVEFSPDNRTLLTAGTDGTTRLWDVESGEELAQLISFPDGTWAVVDPEGRYDASNGGDITGLHWVVGLEAVELSQLKERYYEPRLLAKIRGYDDELLRSVEAFRDVALHPDAQVEIEGSKLRIRLTDRGGGIGRVIVSINGKEITDDARDPVSDPDSESLTLTLDLADEDYLHPGEENAIEVKVFNADGYLSSRGVEKVYAAAGEGGEPTTLWAVVAGVSDYVGETIDLRYAEKDAVDVAAALRLGAQRLFGAEQVHVKLLTTAENEEGTEPPTKANLERALGEIGAEAKSTDILVVYLSGHGVTHGGPEGDYYYLTAEASSGSLEDPQVRDERAVSSEELTDWIRGVAATKQVLILDTCGAGRVVEDLTEDRNVSSSRELALQRLKDRMGLWVLAGSAADAVSYEASRYGQGLLTYSLLMGMRGAALMREEFVDVGTLFNHAVDRVPQLAEDVGGIQRPLLATPGGQSFEIGQLTPEDQAAIAIASPKPFVVRANFQDDERFEDHLELSRRVDEHLRNLSARGVDARLVFVDARAMPEAYLIAGRYRVDETTLTVDVRVVRTSEEVVSLTLSGSTSDVDALVRRIVNEVNAVIETP